jgi:ATP-binding cassette subfamily C protein CydD
VNIASNPPARRYLAAAIAAGFLAAACLLAFMILVTVVVARVFIDGETLASVSSLLGVMAVLLLGRAGLLWSREMLAQRSAGLVKAELRGRVMRHLFALGPVYAQGRRGGELVSTVVNGVEAMDGYITGYRVSMILAGLVPALVLLLVLWIDPPTTLVLLFAGPMLILLMVFIGRRTRDLTERRHEDLNWMSAYFLDMLRGLPTLKLFGRSREQATNIEAISREFGRSTLEVLRTAFQTTLVLEWAATAATAMVALEVSWRLMNGSLPFVEALSVLLLTPEFFLPLRQFAAHHHAGSEGQAASKRLAAIFDVPVTGARMTDDNPQSAAILPQRFDIVFDQVSFTYEDVNQPALNGFSLTIAAGEMVALVGASGAGKSTAAAVLLRFIEPAGGTIAAAGVPLSAIDRAGWRSRVAWVPQQPHLFHGTVADNIRLGRPEATVEQVIAAAEAAHAAEFIRALPLGYDTPLGEEGARLSGGQRQRIALARAFLRDAPLVVLDEATSHLDEGSEALVREALGHLRQGRAVLVIAHRLRLAADAERVAVVEGGRVVATGTHAELLAGNAYYRDLVAAYVSETL